MGKLSGKTALVTGASAGIGESIVRSLSGAGARVILWARRIDRLQSIADSLPAPAHVCGVDVTDPQSIELAIENLPRSFSEVDILVNNAGLARGFGPVYNNTVEEIDDMFDTNVKGLLYVTRAIVPEMVKRKSGHVVNIGSISGRDVYPGGAIYCATKHAVGALTQGLRIDLHDSGVRVSTVDPGLVETDFSLVRFRGDAERADSMYSNTTPLQPDDVAAAVLYVVTTPAHVNVSDVVIYPSVQSSVHLIKRSTS